MLEVAVTPNIRGLGVVRSTARQKVSVCYFVIQIKIRKFIFGAEAFILYQSVCFVYKLEKQVCVTYLHSQHCEVCTKLYRNFEIIISNPPTFTCNTVN